MAQTKRERERERERVGSFTLWRNALVGLRTRIHPAGLENLLHFNDATDSSKIRPGCALEPANIAPGENCVLCSVETHIDVKRRRDYTTIFPDNH